MKILEVTNFFSPVHGGSAEVPYQLSKQLAIRGHEVTVYSSYPDDYETSRQYTDSIPRIEVRFFKTWPNWSNFYITPTMASRVGKDIKRFDVIHMHNYRTFQNAVAHHYARKYGIPYVLQAHGSLATFQKALLKKAFDSVWGYRILKDASAVIAVTEAEAEQYRSMGVSQDRINIIPHGISLSEFSNLPARGNFRRKYGISAPEKIVLYLGRIDKTKGLALLANAFADQARHPNDVRLVIVGPDSGYLGTLRELLKKLRIEDKVVFTGPLYGEGKLEAYVDADVYVLPSSYEIFGITILEACACGTPVIVTERCGAASAVAGKAGLVISYDQERLGYAISTMLSNNKMRQEFSEKGKLLVREKYNWEEIAGEVEGIYKEVKRTQANS